MEQYYHTTKREDGSIEVKEESEADVLFSEFADALHQLDKEEQKGELL